MSRKDSKGMFAAVLGKLDQEQNSDAQIVKSSSPHLMKVAAGVRQMQERSELAERLLKSGEQIVELDPAKIVPSTIKDRFDEAYDAEAIDEIARSMSERGQIVPGLVRPVAGQSDIYQIVYGRRRLAAAKLLGVPFKAAIRALSDQEAVIIQGEENTAREDLSFIEKCLFSLAQEEAGFSRETICASLSTGKSHVSEMIKIGSVVPKPVLHAIGKAPGIGRGRWEEFVHRWQIDDSKQPVDRLIADQAFKAETSDNKFLMLLDALPNTSAPKANETVRNKSASDIRNWAASDNTVRAQIKRTGRKAVLSLEATDGPRFADFIADRLDDLYEQFKAVAPD